MVTYKTLLESCMVKKKKLQVLAWPALAIPKSPHNITIRTYFADKVLHQGSAQVLSSIPAGSQALHLPGGAKTNLADEYFAILPIHTKLT